MGNITGKETIGTSQTTNAGVTSNNADETIDLALTDNLSVPVTSSNTATVTDVTPNFDFSRNILFVLTPSGVSAIATILIPATRRGQFVFKNTLGFDATVGISGQSEAVDTVKDGESSVFSSDGVNCRIAGGGGGVATLEDLTDVDTLVAVPVGHHLVIKSGPTAGWELPASGGGNDALPFVLSPTWRGAIASLAADNTGVNASAGFDIPWDAEIEDTDSIHTTGGSNTRLTVPSGVTRVRLTCQIRLESTTVNEHYSVQIRKNGALFLGAGQTRQEIGNTVAELNIVTPTIPVSPTDYFEARLVSESATTFTIADDRSLFAMEIIETTDTVPSLRTVVVSTPHKYRGVQLILDSDVADADLTPPVQVDWDTATVNTDSMWEGVTNPSRITIPSGVSRVSFEAVFESLNSTADAGDAFIHLFKNGSFERMWRWHASKDNTSTVTAFSLENEPVVEGDYFEVRFGFSGTDVTIGIKADMSYFRAEIIEFNSSTDAPVAYIAIPPEHKGVRINQSTGLSIADNSLTEMDNWDAVEDGGNTFDPGDGGPPQRFWLGVDQTFIDGDVDVANDEIDNLTAHGFQDGEGPITLTSSGTLPAGLALATKYWIIVLDSSTIAFADSRVLALAGTKHTITAAAGGGTHTIETAEKLVIPAGIAKIKIKAGVVFDAAASMVKAFLEIDEGVTPTRVVQYFSQDSVDGNSRAHSETGVLSVTEGEFYLVRAFQDSAGAENALSNDGTNFEIEVVEESRTITFPGVTVTPPNRGALVRKVAIESGANYSAGVTVPFDQEKYDTDTFHDNSTNNSRFTIPTGLGIKKVRLSFGLEVDQVTPADYVRAIVIKGGSVGVTAALPNTIVEITAGASIELSGAGAPIDVVDGDFFEVWLDTESDILVDVAATSWFAIEVIETDENAFPPEQVEFFINGVPGTTDLIFKKTASRRFTLSDNFAGSVAHLATAPSSAIIFDIDRDGVKIGEMLFAASATTATFTTIASIAEVFDVDERFSIDSPANLFGAADLDFSFFAWRS